jgi:hypothetical protein
MGLAVALTGCAAIDVVVPPPSGPCVIMTLDPGDAKAAFAAKPACVVVAWDTTRSPSAIVEGGGIGDPAELRAAAQAAGYVLSCETTVPANPPSSSVSDFGTRFGRQTPGARVWGATLLIRDHSDGAGKGYCRDWLGVR